MLEELLREAERIAKRDHDGHLTLMRFTTGWKAVYGTPDLVHMSDGYARVFALNTYATLEGALHDLLARGAEWHQGDGRP